MQNSKHKVIIIIAALVVLVAGLILAFSAQETEEHAGEYTACTLEAKMCPDGSYVGRTGLNCEFAECPGVNETSNWQTVRDPGSGIRFQYPENLPTTYIEAQDWPPQVRIVEESFSCTEAGEATARAGRTEERLTNGRTYCVTEVIEGTAGSVYTQYAYAAPMGGNTAILTFSIRAPQCRNYDDPQRNACEAERSSFDMDTIVDQIMQTLQRVD